MTYSRALEDFVKGWESCSLTPYRDSAGKLTIGWGHLLQPGDPAVNCTQDEADSLLVTDLSYVADRVAAQCSGVDLSQQQFDALCDFTFEFGPARFATSHLRTCVLTLDFDRVPHQLMLWVYDHDPKTGKLVEVDGLRKRRAAEVEIWTYGRYDARP